MSIRCLIIAADPLVRSALGSMAEQGDELTVVGQASPEEDAVELLNVYRPEIVIIDAGWNFEEDELLLLLEDWMLPLILLLPEEDALVGQLISAGYQAVLPRILEAGRLEAAVLAVNQGLVVIDPQFTDHLSAGTNPSPQFDIEEVEQLTPREFDVLEHLADGLTNREIAAKLGISHHTVKFHLTSLMDKLDVHSRTEAVTKASRLGILEI